MLSMLIAKGGSQLWQVPLTPAPLIVTTPMVHVTAVSVNVTQVSLVNIANAMHLKERVSKNVVMAWL